MSLSGRHGHRPSSSRSALVLERQLDGAVGVPYSWRSLAAASEGRSRLVSEIRNVLDLMRRGEALRFEDVMILDQSVFFGMGDIHDRHRDMRLDVDNMSYEELLALEERIGNVCTGLGEETILNRLKQRKYVCIKTEEPVDVEPCCVCQEEYKDGEDLGKLDCGHDFHTDCIKQWFMQKNLCPICKTTGLKT
uniref:RING-type E3 ubiquitin transferase n=1 Tax=Nicotiana benthamiana TaxID=4100 RepID=X5D278_NICBE|nr:C3HC4-type RING finger protein [Nicotiana benthamiana]